MAYITIYRWEYKCHYEISFKIQTWGALLRGLSALRFQSKKAFGIAAMEHSAASRNPIFTAKDTKDTKQNRSPRAAEPQANLRFEQQRLPKQKEEGKKMVAEI